jgi:hypothetical protein
MLWSAKKMTTELHAVPANLDIHKQDEPETEVAQASLTTDPVDKNGVDETPEYPLSAPIKPDDPERRSDQSKAESAGLVEEEMSTYSEKSSPEKLSFKLALGSALLVAVSMGIALCRRVSRSI